MLRGKIYSDGVLLNLFMLFNGSRIIVSSCLVIHVSSLLLARCRLERETWLNGKLSSTVDSAHAIHCFTTCNDASLPICALDQAVFSGGKEEGRH